MINIIIITNAIIMNPFIVIDHSKSYLSAKYPDAEGPMKAPNAEAELKNPAISPKVCIFS